MAIAIDKSGANPQDYSYCTHSRTVAGTPNGTTTPLFAGEIIFDTTNKVRWKALTTANSTWEPQKAEVT